MVFIILSSKPNHRGSNDRSRLPQADRMDPETENLQESGSMADQRHGNPGQFYTQEQYDPSQIPAQERLGPTCPHPPQVQVNSQSRKHRGNASTPTTVHQASSKRARTRPAVWQPLFREIPANGPRNIVIFGETGTGKSSLINMLSDDDVATVSNGALGCTFESACYPITINGTQYVLWDTAGLNEGEAGSVPAGEALHHLRDLVEKLKDGLSLLVYCIRGARYRDIIKVNYDLFTEIICQKEIPVVIVITGLENEARMEDWWVVNREEFTSRKLDFVGHACVTTSKGKKNMFEEEYEESKDLVRTLIQTRCPEKAWTVDSNLWFDRITERIQEYYDDYNGYSRPTTVRDEVRGGSSNGLFSLISAMVVYLADAFRQRR